MCCHFECAVIASIKKMNEKGKPGVGDLSSSYLCLRPDEKYQMEIWPNISFWSVNALGALTSHTWKINISVINIINWFRMIGSAGCGSVNLFFQHYVDFFLPQDAHETNRARDWLNLNIKELVVMVIFAKINTILIIKKKKKKWSSSKRLWGSSKHTYADMLVN